MERIAELKK